MLQRGGRIQRGHSHEGGRLGVTISPRLGVETSVSYVPSKLRFTIEQTQTTTDANLLLGTVRATFHAIPMTSPVWLTLNGGASLIRRGGDAYAEAEDKGDVGGVVGAAVGFRLGSMLSFYVAAEDYIYGTRVEGTGLAEESRTQNDVQLAFGFGFRWAAERLIAGRRRSGPRLSRGRDDSSLVGTVPAIKLVRPSFPPSVRHPRGTCEVELDPGRDTAAHAARRRRPAGADPWDLEVRSEAGNEETRPAHRDRAGRQQRQLRG
jgi:hypothetical protein